MIELYRKDFSPSCYETYEADVRRADDFYVLIFCHNFYTDKNIYGEKKVMSDNITYLHYFKEKKAKKLGMDRSDFLDFLKDTFDEDLKMISKICKCYYTIGLGPMWFKIRMSMRTLVRDEAGVEKRVDWCDDECDNPVVARMLKWGSKLDELSPKFDDFEIYKHRKIEMAFRALVMGERLEKDFVGNERALKNLEKINELHDTIFLVGDDKTKLGKKAREKKLWDMISNEKIK